MKTAPIALDGFSIFLGERPLVEESDFALEPGSSSVVLGPTGVGKSVLLKAVAGLLPARPFRLGGSMRVQGIDAYVNGRKTGHALLVEDHEPGPGVRPRGERAGHESGPHPGAEPEAPGAGFAGRDRAQAQGPFRAGLRLLRPPVPRRGFRRGAAAHHPDDPALPAGRPGAARRADREPGQEPAPAFHRLPQHGNPSRRGQDGADGQPRPGFHPGPETGRRLRPGERPAPASGRDPARRRLPETGGQEIPRPKGFRYAACPRATSSAASSGNACSRPSRASPSSSAARPSTGSPALPDAASPA